LPSTRLSLADVRTLAERVFLANDVAPATAATMAGIIADTERAHIRSHGLAMLPLYVSSLRCGWIDGQAVATTETPTPSVLRIDGNNGLAQAALRGVEDMAVAMTRAHGTAVVTMHNAHHIGALGLDAELFARNGLVALTMVTARPRVVPWQGSRPVFGTDPIAFACRRADGGMVLVDMASSVCAISDIRLAQAEGRQLDEPAGLDAAGQPSTDPTAVLEAGKLLPFGKHKGSAVALIVEILAGALSGGRFSFEDASTTVEGAQSANSGQFLLLLDPERIYGPGFVERLIPLLQAIDGNGDAHVPGASRDARCRRSERNGVEVPRVLLERIEGFCD